MSCNGCLLLCKFHPHAYRHKNGCLSNPRCRELTVSCTNLKTTQQLFPNADRRLDSWYYTNQSETMKGCYTTLQLRGLNGDKLQTVSLTVCLLRYSSGV